MDRVKSWVESELSGAQLQGFPYNGQLRFVVPAQHQSPSPSSDGTSAGKEPQEVTVEIDGPSGDKESVSIKSLFVLFEENKGELGVEFYSIQPSNFDEVFLRVVARHNVGEEDRQVRKRKWYEHLVRILV
jgi:hypothetical protein